MRQVDGAEVWTSRRPRDARDGVRQPAAGGSEGEAEAGGGGVRSQPAHLGREYRSAEYCRVLEEVLQNTNEQPAEVGHEYRTEYY